MEVLRALRVVIGLTESQSQESKCFHFLPTPLGYHDSVELRARDRRSCKRIIALSLLNHHTGAFTYNPNLESVIFYAGALNGTEKVVHELQSDRLSVRLT